MAAPKSSGQQIMTWTPAKFILRYFSLPRCSEDMKKNSELKVAFWVCIVVISQKNKNNEIWLFNGTGKKKKIKGQSKIQSEKQI